MNTIINCPHKVLILITIDYYNSQSSPRKLLFAMNGNEYTGPQFVNEQRMGTEVLGPKWDIYITPLPLSLRFVKE